MEDRNLSKALEIMSKLIIGDEISRDNKDTAALYDEYMDNSEVYDITNTICKNMNITLYEYENSVFASAGENNRVFGYSNDELKKEIGVKLNRELFLCYFIIYNVIKWFYNDTGNSTFNEYVKVEDLVNTVDNMLSVTINKLQVMDMSEIEQNSFKSIALTWEDLPMTVSEDMGIRAARGSKTGFVKMTMNFLMKQDLMIENEGRYYPKKRFKALICNYFEEYKGRLYEIMNNN